VCSFVLCVLLICVCARNFVLRVCVCVCNLFDVCVRVYGVLSYVCFIFGCARANLFGVCACV